MPVQDEPYSGVQPTSTYKIAMEGEVMKVNFMTLPRMVIVRCCFVWTKHYPRSTENHPTHRMLVYYKVMHLMERLVMTLLGHIIDTITCMKWCTKTTRFNSATESSHGRR